MFEWIKTWPKLQSPDNFNFHLQTYFLLEINNRTNMAHYVRVFFKMLEIIECIVKESHTWKALPGGKVLRSELFPYPSDIAKKMK